ncbi:MAG: response regulator transcription factor [Synergistaceae bacterium]|nr:response regulator transcription factor [Synergistaceae bacterium]
MIRILLADDHVLFREGLKSLLTKENDMELVGLASNGEEAVKMAKSLRPDVILMDVTMPNINGIQATERIMEDHNDISIIALSMHSDKRYIVESLKAGSRGYILKESSLQTVLQAIRSVMAGNIYLSSKVCTVIVEDYLKLINNSDENTSPPLSPREREVLVLLVKGRNSKQIADFLTISKNTVDTHRRRILDKLGCESVAELTKYAIREGFLTLE